MFVTSFFGFFRHLVTPLCHCERSCCHCERSEAIQSSGASHWICMLTLYLIRPDQFNKGWLGGSTWIWLL